MTDKSSDFQEGFRVKETCKNLRGWNGLQNCLANCLIAKLVFLSLTSRHQKFSILCSQIYSKKKNILQCKYLTNLNITLYHATYNVCLNSGSHISLVY